jgi:NADPH:quinone reductase-like Zn-dependent oxidoreductase
MEKSKAPGSMLAAIYRRYGPPGVVRIERTPVPRVGDDSVLVKIVLTTVSSADARLRELRVPGGFWAVAPLALGVLRPRTAILGSEFAGVVERVGAKVTRFKPGDRVFGGDDALGCHAEFKAIPETGCIDVIPAHLSPHDAVATMFGGNTALGFLDIAKVARGMQVLVVGASGAVGSAAIQIARIQGAEVTGVCGARNAARVLGWGANQIVDYASGDYTAGTQRYDVIFDATGAASLSACRKILAPRGRLILAAGGVRQTFLLPGWSAIRGGPRVIAGPMDFGPARFKRLAEWVWTGAFKPFVERTYPFAQIVEAHAAVDDGRKVGNIAVEVP